jgi:hypothetical protein
MVDNIECKSSVVGQTPAEMLSCSRARVLFMMLSSPIQECDFFSSLCLSHPVSIAQPLPLQHVKNTT